MKFNRKIAPNTKPKPNFVTKKRLREDEINFDKLRSYRLDRVKKELEKNNLEACILFDPVNVRYALDTTNMSIYNMHNLTRYCFIPVNGPVILYEYFNCEELASHLNLINEIRPAITWDYFSNGDQAGDQLEKWINEVKDLANSYCKSKKLAIDVLNGPAVTALNKAGIEVVDAKLIVEQARVIKSPEELKCMKTALDVAEIGINKMREELKAGMTEDELWSILHKTNIEYELFQEDLDRIAPHIESAIKRVPAFGEVGVKKVYNGAICYTPDGNPIVGPAWGLKNFWINEGHSFGITAAGGAGWQHR